MAVGADEGIGIRDHLAVRVFTGPNDFCQIFQVHLVTDTGAGWHDAEVRKCLLAPFQKLIALHIALKFQVHVVLQRGCVTGFVDHHRVVDDQIDRGQRVNFVWIAAHRDHGVAHRCQVDNGGDAGEVLHQDARRKVSDFMLRGLRIEPRTDRFHVFDGDRAAVFTAQKVFQHDLQ